MVMTFPATAVWNANAISMSANSELEKEDITSTVSLTAMSVRWWAEGLEEEGVGDAVVLRMQEERMKRRTGLGGGGGVDFNQDEKELYKRGHIHAHTQIKEWKVWSAALSCSE